MQKESNTINELSEVIKKLSEEERTILLYRLNIKQLQKGKRKQIANPSKGVKNPSMEEIDAWKHEARKTIK